MNIRSKYVREQKRYLVTDLMDKFNLNLEQTVDLIKKLKIYGVLKMVKASYKEKNLTDLVNEELEIVDVDLESDEYFYVFTFVGVLTVGDIIIKCFPKYLLSLEEPLDEMKQVLKVLNRYNSKEQIINLYNGEDEQRTFNLLSVILYLLNDYHENGTYTNQENIIETNGDGEILWDKTINETFAVISNNRPFYIELQTANTIDDEMDFFRRLHQCVISECSRKLEEADLLELFEIEGVNISEESLLDFGDVDYILYRLQLELNVQFVSRKQNLLKTLYTYVANSRLFEDNYGLSMYGTNSFNLIWERVCSEVFDNQLAVPIGKMKLPSELHTYYNNMSKDTLLKVIDKPIWRYFESDDIRYNHEVTDTLIPDLVSIYEKQDGMYFGIFDAKYYNIVLDKDKVEHQPGIGDITKQYLYQLAYIPFISRHSFAGMQNAFLMPSENEEAVLSGEVELSMLKDISNPRLTNILVVKIPAKKIYNYYLSENKVDIYEEYPFL